MTTASPGDLSVVFRSLPRRLREAHGDASGHPVPAATNELDERLAEAGQLLATSKDPVALADAVAAVPPDEWNDATLARLREIALDLGRLLRQISADGPSDDDDDR